MKSFEELKKKFEIPSVVGSGLSTQFSIGLNYWSPVHTDDDFFYTLLSCTSDKVKSIDDVIYKFVFPEYNFYVYLRPGDIMIFNPLVKHCCTNPGAEDCYIFSCYVSKKTVLASVSSADNSNI
jgi:hypothetical protein